MVNAPHVSSKEFRTSLLIIAIAAAAVVLAIDVSLDEWAGIAALYVVPVLISSVNGPPRTPVIAAWIASMLVVTGLLKAPWGTIPLFAFVNRALDIGIIWTAAVMVARLRATSGVLETRTRDLADVNYAINQFAIVAVTDVRGIIRVANDKFCEISKYSREEILGQDHRILNSGYHSKEFMRNLWHTIANGHVWRGEIRNRAKDGSIYWVDTTIVPFLDDRKKPYQYLAIRYDISDRKRSEEQLREQAALTKLGAMAAVVAHEVKNPIAGIRGALQVIMSRMAPDQRDRAIVGDIIGRLDALNGIVQDLLVFARPRELHLESVDIGRLIGDTADLLRRDPAIAGVEIRVSGGGAVVRADAEQLQIVFQNVLMNAAQAMVGRGAIDVAIGPNGGGAFHVSITDHGPGMPPEVLSRAFDAFFTTKSRGTGLGLPIARRIVEAHGSHLQVETVPGGGTTISFDLPAAG